MSTNTTGNGRSRHELARTLAYLSIVKRAKRILGVAALAGLPAGLICLLSGGFDLATSDAFLVGGVVVLLVIGLEWSEQRLKHRLK